MNRRGFLGMLAAGMVLDPERAIWRPGAKLISIPKPATVRMCGLDYFAIDWPGSRGEWSFGIYVSEMIAANEILRRKLDTRYE